MISIHSRLAAGPRRTRDVHHRRAVYRPEGQVVHRRLSRRLHPRVRADARHRPRGVHRLRRLRAECPVEAIYPEDALPDKWSAYVEINYAYPDGATIDRLVDQVKPPETGELAASAWEPAARLRHRARRDSGELPPLPDRRGRASEPRRPGPRGDADVGARAPSADLVGVVGQRLDGHEPRRTASSGSSSGSATRGTSPSRTSTRSPSRRCGRSPARRACGRSS